MAAVTPGTIRLIIAGESRDAEAALSRVGDAARGMGERAAEGSDGLRRASRRSADDWIESADKMEQRSMGFRDTITGIQDGFKGLTDDSLPLQDRLLLLGTGVGDLSSGFANFLIPAISSLSTLMSGPLATAFSFIAAHPLVFALIAIVAVVALLIIHWDTIKEVAGKAMEAIGGFITDHFGGPINWVKDKFVALIDWVKGVPTLISDAFKGLVGIITWPYRTAFNFISDAWNGTIGKLSWTIPSWVPVVGGNTVSAPKLPKFHSGGLVPGLAGSEMLAILQAGERVIPAQGGGSVGVTFHGNTSDALATVIMGLIRSGKIQLSAGV